MAVSKIRFLAGLSLLLLSLTSIPAQAQSPAGDPIDTTDTLNLPAQKLRVGVIGTPPTVVVSPGLQQVSGTAVQYWKELAQPLKLNYQFIPYSNTNEVFEALANGKLDLAIGNIGITAERIAQFDFTQPIFQANLTLLLPSSPPTLWSTMRPFLGWAFLSSVGGIFLCITVVGNLLWLAERHHNSGQFPPTYFKGVREGMWCALVTFTTVGYGDRFPVTRLGRAVISVWMVLSLVVVTSLTAGIATTLAVAFSARPLAQFSHPEDLRGARIATVGRESASTQWATFYQARISETSSLTDAIALLESNRVEGILYTRDDLEYYLHQHPRVSYQLATFNIASEYLGIALPRNSVLTRPLNELILQSKFQLRLQEIRSNWSQYLDQAPRKKGL